MWNTEDPVVKEIPVFVSKALNGQLNMLQFQLNSMAVPLQDDAPVVHAKIKPNQEKLQLGLETNTNSHYSKSRGQFLQAAALGKAKNSGGTREEKSDLLREQILESMTIPSKSKSKRYVAGVVRNGQLHISPLQSIVQMHNKFWYLNDADEKAKSSKQIEEEDGDSDTEGTEPTKITVKFKRGATGTNDETKVRHPKTYRAVMDQLKDEPWVELDYYGIGENEDEIEKLCSGAINQSDTPYYVIEKQNYLEKLFPKQTEAEVEGITSLFTSKSVPS